MQLFTKELVDRYELVVPLPRQESGQKGAAATSAARTATSPVQSENSRALVAAVGGLQVSLQAAQLKISGYSVKPVSCSVNVQPSLETGESVIWTAGSSLLLASVTS